MWTNEPHFIVHYEDGRDGTPPNAACSMKPLAMNMNKIHKRLLPRHGFALSFKFPVLIVHTSYLQGLA